MSNEERLLRLERSNRRLKIGVGVLGIGATALAILGAAQPAPKIITAERFVLVDPSGKERAELSSNNTSAALQLLNLNGSKAAVMATGSTGNALLLFDADGKGRQSLIASRDEADYSIFSEDKPKDSFKLTDKPQGTVMSINDARGNDLINIGQTEGRGAGIAINDPRDVPRVMIGSQGVLTFTKDGKTEWASFGENMTPEERKQVIDMLNSQH